MKVDESKIPQGEHVQIKCPHCQSIDEFPQDSKTTTEPIIEHNQAVNTEMDQQKKPANHISNATIPDDAFRGFRFPAEKESQINRSPRNTTMNLKFWLILGSIIVAGFALLVNIILPGPMEGTQFHQKAPSRPDTSK